jgi:RNA polymerase sigma factor (TIGR02999 family)
MAAPSPKDVTQLLLAWSQGDQVALEKLVPLVYDELHRLAKRFMSREPGGHVLQTTALIHEAYLKLVDAKGIHWQNRAHFFAISANVMRRVLVDFARSQNYQKRGGKFQRVSFDEKLLPDGTSDPDLVALDDALKSLARFDERKSKIVEMKFFAGLSVDETAQALKLSPDTIMRDWRLAKVWLMRELTRKKNGL